MISSEFDKEDYYLYGENGRSSFFSVCEYIAEYGNEFYNIFFGNRELRIFEREFSRYVTGRKKITYNREFYVFGRKMDLREFHTKGTAQIQKIYKDNSEYLKLLTQMNYTKSSYTNSLVATFVAVIAVIIAAISLWVSCR